MLRYSCKVSKGDTLCKIPFKELYVAQDLSFISGTTDGNLSISSADKLILRNTFETSECEVEWEDKKRQGLCLINIPFKVKEIIINNITHKYI